MKHFASYLHVLLALNLLFHTIVFFICAKYFIKNLTICVLVEPNIDLVVIMAEVTS